MASSLRPGVRYHIQSDDYVTYLGLYDVGHKDIVLRGERDSLLQQVPLEIFLYRHIYYLTELALVFNSGFLQPRLLPWPTPPSINIIS